MKKDFFLIVIPLFLMACAAPVVHNTASGRPEVSINGKVAAQAKSEIMNLMINNKYNVKSANDTLLIFERKIENILAAAMLSSKYDSSPVTRVSFNIIEMEDLTRIVASFEAVTNPGSAFEKITPMDNNTDTASYQMRLNEIKQRIESK